MLTRLEPEILGILIVIDVTDAKNASSQGFVIFCLLTGIRLFPVDSQG
jgi:hypothetical protein